MARSYWLPASFNESPKPQEPRTCACPYPGLNSEVTLLGAPDIHVGPFIANPSSLYACIFP